MKKWYVSVLTSLLSITSFATTPAPTNNIPQLLDKIVLNTGSTAITTRTTLKKALNTIANNQKTQAKAAQHYIYGTDHDATLSYVLDQSLVMRHFIWSTPATSRLVHLG